MILFLPINVYRARYQAGEGRPYSAFERLLLEAVATGTLATTDELAAAMCMPERLVIEAVAMLFEAGWVALGDHDALVITAAGRRALAGSNVLPASMIVRDGTAWVVQERLCGQVILQHGVTYARRAELEKENLWHKGWELHSSGEVPPSLDPGQIVPLLHLHGSAYLHWVGSVDIHRSGADFLVVTVDPDTGMIANLPRAWDSALRTVLVDYARYFRDKILERGEVTPDEKWTQQYHVAEDADPTPTEWSVDPESVQLLLGRQAHDRVIRAALSEECEHVFVATTTLSEVGVGQLLPSLNEGLVRGIAIDILWGHVGDPEQHKRALAQLKKLQADSARRESGGRLHVNSAPSGCHAELLICGGHARGWAAFGCHRWLDETDDDARSVSLQIRAPAPVASLCRLMADFANRDPSLSAGSAPIHLPNLATKLEAGSIHSLLGGDDDDDGIPATATSGRPTLRIWLERQQRAALVRLAKNAGERLLIASPEVDGSSAVRELDLIFDRGIAETTRLDLRYASAKWSQAQQGAVVERTLKRGGSLAPEASLRASVVVADADTLVLSTHHWLMPFLPVARTMASTIGIEVTGTGLTEALVAWILPNG